MSFLSYLRVDTGRLLRAKTAWLVILLTSLCPLAGYGFYRPAAAATTASVVLANPALAGGLYGAFLFAFLTLFEFNRVHKARTDILTDAIISPVMFSLVKLCSLLAAGLATVLLTAVAYLPNTLYQMDMIFSISDYILSYFLFMLCSVWLAILAASAFYLIIRRVDLSFILFVVFAFFSLSTWCSDEYLLRWINPLVPIFSSDFSNGIVFRTSGYSRLFWFALLSGFWLLSLLCVRNHGKGLPGSLVHNVRKVYVPILAILLLCGGAYLYSSEPLIDHSPLETYDADTNTSEIAVSTGLNSYAEDNPNLTLLSTSLKASIDTRHHSLSNTVTYQLQNSGGQPQNCTLQLNPGYTIHSIFANGKALDFTDKQNDHDNSKDVVCILPANEKTELTVAYSGSPKIWSECRMFFLCSQIEKNYVELGGADLRPSVNVAHRNNAELSGEITLPNALELISRGNTPKVLRENDDGTKTWNVRDRGGRITIYAGDYEKVKIEGSGMPVYLCYSQKHRKQMEDMNIKQVLENTISYCTLHYGSLPFTADEPLCILQGSAYMQGGGILGNISVMSESSFSKEGLADEPQEGTNSEEIKAHEIVHQWWGGSACCMDKENLNWTNEGVTVYTTYRLMKELHGSDYAQKNYVDVWKADLMDEKNNFYNRHPEYLNILPEKYVSNLQSLFATTNTYSGMAFKIYKAAQLVGGEEKMDAILAKLYKNGGTEMPPYITWHDFLNACGLKEEDLNLE